MTKNQLLIPVLFAIDTAMCYLNRLPESSEPMEFES
jgi:hypothetical protein